jgi:hypothetical protein
VPGLFQTVSGRGGKSGGLTRVFDVPILLERAVKRESANARTYPRSRPPRPVNTDATFIAVVLTPVTPPLAEFADSHAEYTRVQVRGAGAADSRRHLRLFSVCSTRARLTARHARVRRRRGV